MNYSNRNMIEKIKKLNNIQKFLYLLLIYSIIVILFNWSQIIPILFHAVTLFGSYMILNFLHSKIFHLKKLNSRTMYISLLILFLILHPLGVSIESALVNILLVCSLFIIKSIRIKNKPLINPVVGASILGGIVLYFSQFIFQNDTLFISWWGASFSGSIGLTIITIFAIYAAYLFRKLPLLISFLVTQISILFVSNQLSIYSVTVFLAGIMLLEIKTSPIKKYEQIIFGIFGAILVIYTHSIFDIDHQILAIGIINILFVGYNNILLPRINLRN